LSKNFGKANVCTILFNLDNADITGPLTSFQATKFDKTDFKKLLTTINNTGGESKLEPAVLNDVFEMWWPKLENKIKDILSTTSADTANNQRTDREILEEVLELTRINSKRMPRRNELTRETLLRLMDVIQEMHLRMMKTSNRKDAAIMFEEFIMPMQRLCMELDSPELFDRFMMRREKYFVIENENEKKE
jgi:hypothetical protein